jgi:hypothetical protein
MLSPHEFTTLMVVRDAPDQVDPDRAELRTLLDLRLVALEPLTSRQRCLRLTTDGHAFLKAMSRIS